MTGKSPLRETYLVFGSSHIEVGVVVARNDAELRTALAMALDQELRDQYVAQNAWAGTGLPAGKMAIFILTEDTEWCVRPMETFYCPDTRQLHLSCVQRDRGDRDSECSVLLVDAHNAPVAVSANFLTRAARRADPRLRASLAASLAYA